MPLTGFPIRRSDALTVEAAMNVIAYVRRSKESGARTVSLADQETRVRAYAESQSWAVAAVLVDDGVSGGRREGFDRIRAAVTTYRARAVVVYRLDRFARDVAGLLETTADVLPEGGRAARGRARPD